MTGVADAIEVTESHEARVGDLTVRRALPRPARRTIGAWCFVDHFGPVDVAVGAGLDTAPHPHMGLQTVTWVLEGEVVHRDSLGSEQPIRPGELNLMTAGHGVSHSEEGMGARSGRAHGVQLWVAMPERTRHGAAAFEHHGSLPAVELGDAVCTVLVGGLLDSASPARRDTDHVGIDVSLRPGEAVLPLASTAEHGVAALSGAVELDGTIVTLGHLAYLPPGRDELRLRAGEPSRVLLIGGTPFEARISMFWNFVARTHDELDEAYRQWQADDGRFGSVRSSLARIPSPRPPWQR
jgi:redox-sensitive bicupin YhaK (pirin superfamily)